MPALGSLGYKGRQDSLSWVIKVPGGKKHKMSAGLFYFFFFFFGIIASLQDGPTMSLTSLYGIVLRSPLPF